MTASDTTIAKDGKHMEDGGPLTTDHSKAVPENEGVAFGTASESSRAARKRSLDVADHTVPTGREEEWRFTPVKDLAPLFVDAPDDIVDGQPPVDYTVDVPDGVEINTLRRGQAPRDTAVIPEDIVGAIAGSRCEEALHVRVPKGAEYDAPLRVGIHGNGVHRRANAQLVLETAESARATIVLDHTGSADYAQNVEIIAGDDSELTVVSLQSWDDDALHVATHGARVGKDAKVRHIVVSLGGHVVRLNSTMAFAAPGGDVDMLGVYFSDSHQVLEHRTFIDHAAPKCTSNVTYKGALQGEGARSVWVGDVLIRAIAEGTSTYELNRNLVLTEGARADSVPNLEIETGEIEGAGHASATGRFDDEQLFYLESRGIEEKDARRLVVHGFFAEVIQKIKVPEVEEQVLRQIDSELTRTLA